MVDGLFDAAALVGLRDRFESVRRARLTRYGAATLQAIDEHNTIRCMLADDSAFLDLALNPQILNIAERMLGPGFILNQQNGIINPGDGASYNQASYHRDLPYQHFTSSRPLALNALFCIDDFALDNGATLVVPASSQGGGVSIRCVGGRVPARGDGARRFLYRAGLHDLPSRRRECQRARQEGGKPRLHDWSDTSTN